MSYPSVASWKHQKDLKSRSVLNHHQRHTHANVTCNGNRWKCNQKGDKIKSLKYTWQLEVQIWRFAELDLYMFHKAWQTMCSWLIADSITSWSTSNRFQDLLHTHSRSKTMDWVYTTGLYNYSDWNLAIKVSGEEKKENMHTLIWDLRWRKQLHDIGIQIVGFYFLLQKSSIILFKHLPSRSFW